MQVSGTLQVGEANATARSVGARQRGPALYFYGILLVFGALGALAGGLLAPRIADIATGDGAFYGFMAGILLYALTARRLTVYVFRRRFARKGLPQMLPLSLQITGEALIYELGDVRNVAKWRCVTEIFCSSGYWIFLVQSAPWFAPIRFFATRADERAFVAAALAQMSVEAQARSPDAAAFVKTIA
jgi:hypothetical protein